MSPQYNHYTNWRHVPKCEAGDFYRYPRTLAQAFPRHVSHELATPYQPMTKQDKALTAFYCVVLVCLLISLFFGVI